MSKINSIKKIAISEDIDIFSFLKHGSQIKFPSAMVILGLIKIETIVEKEGVWLF